jgi:RNase P subunit RPR2
MGTMWSKEYCPKCKAVNWINLGSMSVDMSGIDPDGYKCRECGHIHFFGDQEMYDFEAECGAWESIEDCYWELGLEHPD